MVIQFPNYIYLQIVKFCIVLNEPIFNNEYFDQDYLNVRQKYMITTSLVCKKWFKYCQICKFKLNTNEIYKHLLKIPDSTTVFTLATTKEITQSELPQLPTISPQHHQLSQYSLIDFNNITMLNLYKINRSIMKLLFQDYWIQKQFKNLEFIVEGINTLVESDFHSILSNYKCISSKGVTNIKLILNLYVSGSFSFTDDQCIKLYNELNVQTLTITTDHMNSVSNDLLQFIYTLNPDNLSFNSLYSGPLKLNSTLKLIRSGTVLLDGLIESFKSKNLTLLEIESFSELFQQQRPLQDTTMDGHHQFNLSTFQELNESIINNQSIKSLTIKINKQLLKFDGESSKVNSGCPFVIEFFSKSFQSNQSITSLTLSGFTFLQYIPQFIESLKSNKSITSLSLTNGSLVSGANQFESLLELVQSNNKICDLNIKNNKIQLNESTIKQFLNIKSLKSLTLSNNTFNNIEIKHYNDNLLLDLII